LTACVAKMPENTGLRTDFFSCGWDGPG